MANYLAMNREELAAEKRLRLRQSTKSFQAKGLKLNMARGKPGLTRWIWPWTC